MADVDFQPGSMVGEYEIVGELGRGGQAVVYTVKDTRDGSIWAAKVFMDPTLPDASHSPQLVDRFAFMQGQLVPRLNSMSTSVHVREILIIDRL